MLLLSCPDNSGQDNQFSAYEKVNIGFIGFEHVVGAIVRRTTRMGRSARVRRGTREYEGYIPALLFSSTGANVRTTFSVGAES